MDYKKIKKQANNILKNLSEECSYIEYKASASQKDKILKTICAYANNYYNNDIQYIFLGVEEVNDDKNKAIPRLPIKGIENGAIEKCKNEMKALNYFLYPNVKYELIANEYEGNEYLLIVVPPQTGGPFMVSDRVENDKRMKLKPGRYVRIEAESRLARVYEEYDLIRKFSNYHFSSISNNEAIINDLNEDILKDYIYQTTNKDILKSFSKMEIAKTLGLIDKNDPTESYINNFAILMFCDTPEKFIKYAYTEVIIDLHGTKNKMESKIFKGPVWKQYKAIVNFINDNILRTIIVREDNRAEHRKIYNFPFTAVEELVANAIVHNNYENEKTIQIYITNSQINIINYNRPLPPLSLEDLNERLFFNERDTENPELRDMFKSLGFIESFGTGIGEAKRSMEKNGSPELYYKIFEDYNNVTSVVIPVNKEFLEYNEPKILRTDIVQVNNIKDIINNSSFSNKVKHNLVKIYETIGFHIFGSSKIVEILNCSGTTATSYIDKLYDGLNIIKPVEGQGKGKYIFYIREM